MPDALDLARLKVLIQRLAVPEPDLNVATTGSGPFDEPDFDEFLRGCGTEPHYVDPEASPTAVIAGSDDFDADAIWALLDASDGRRIRFFTQESYLAFRLTHIDPYSLPEDELRLLMGDHPLVDFLDETWTTWPSTLVSPSVHESRAEVGAGMVERGYLHSLGYRVGKTGLSATQRRTLLRQAWSGTLPLSFPQDYRDEWGSPETAVRLKKISRSIAAFCRNQRRKKRPALQAIADWEADLEWLKREFYRGRFRFDWPSAGYWRG